MKHRLRFESFVEHPDRSGVFVDFDGSLAPIVDDPARARPLPAARAALDALARELARVAVVSGRPVDFLERALELDSVEYFGIYGMQRLVDGRPVAHPDAAPFEASIADALAAARRELPPELVEAKGGLTFTMHYRTAPERAAAVIALSDSLARDFGLRAVPGRLAVELRPPIEVDKGTVTRDESRDLDHVAFVGDDHGDLVAFDALDELIALGGLESAVRVAVQSDEAPPELLRRADVVVASPTALAELLGELVAEISDRRRRAR